MSNKRIEAMVRQAGNPYYNYHTSNPRRNPVIHRGKSRVSKRAKNRALYTSNRVQPKQPYGPWRPQQTTKQSSWINRERSRTLRNGNIPSSMWLFLVIYSTTFLCSFDSFSSYPLLPFSVTSKLASQAKGNLPKKNMPPSCFCLPPQATPCSPYSPLSK